MQSISKSEAANRIISKFEIDPNLELALDTSSYADRQALFLEFSTLIRTFIQSNLDDEAAIVYCEKVSLKYRYDKS